MWSLESIVSETKMECDVQQSENHFNSYMSMMKLIWMVCNKSTRSIQSGKLYFSMTLSRYSIWLVSVLSPFIKFMYV